VPLLVIAKRQRDRLEKRPTGATAASVSYRLTVPRRDDDFWARFEERQHEEVLAQFHDANGEPKLVDCAVLFLDVLGTSSAAEASVHDAEVGNARLRELIPAITDAREFGLLDSKGLYATTYFSDNIVSAAPLREPGDTEVIVEGFFVMAGRVQLALAQHGFFARGAVAFGPHYMDEANAFGPALVEAVRLEKSVADVPRVVLSERVVALARKHLSYYFNSAHAPGRRILLTDSTACSFVSYLAVLFAEIDDAADAADLLCDHRDRVTQQLEEWREGDPRVWRKLQWVGRYHNWFCDQLGSKAEASRIADTLLPVEFGRFAEDIPLPPPDEGDPFEADL
jgi:hypothetical protein